MSSQTPESFEKFQARLEAGASAADELAEKYTVDEQFARVMKRLGAADVEPAPNPAAQAFKSVAQEQPVLRAPVESLQPQIPTTPYRLDIDTCQE